MISQNENEILMMMQCKKYEYVYRIVREGKGWDASILNLIVTFLRKNAIYLIVVVKLVYSNEWRIGVWMLNIAKLDDHWLVWLTHLISWVKGLIIVKKWGVQFDDI